MCILRTLGILSCQLLIFSCHLFGQISSINFSVKEGLPSPETYSIHEDADGYIWITTDRGLSRYNGYEFENFSTKDGLSYNTVFDIFEDDAQNLWITAFDGSITIYDFEQKQLKPFHLNKMLKVQSGSQTLGAIGFSNGHVDIFRKMFNNTIYKHRYSYNDTIHLTQMGLDDLPLKYDNIDIRLGLDINSQDSITGLVYFDESIEASIGATTNDDGFYCI